MRVFILSTGRSGSATIVKACQHINNYTASHESLTKSLGDERFNYQDNHIESDNKLSWHLGHLDKIYGDDAFYVHLKRDREMVAKSFMKRFFIPGSTIDAFCILTKLIPAEKLTKDERLQVCYDYVDVINLNIEHFLLRKKNVMNFSLENSGRDFKVLWNRIGAEGDIEKALEEFNVKHNASKKRKMYLLYRIKLLLIREWRNTEMFFSNNK